MPSPFYLQGTGEELLQDERVKKAYLGE